MVSRLNLVGMRRRWASLPDDPGWSARLPEPPSASGGGGGGGGGAGGGRQAIVKAVSRRFLAGELMIDCPSPACTGLFLTESREIERHGSTGTRVVLRCTRKPEEHEVKLSMGPYTAEEADVLRSALSRGEQPSCVRCGHSLGLGSVESPDGWAKSVSIKPAYYCPWCGVKWVPPSDRKRRAG